MDELQALEKYFGGHVELISSKTTISGVTYYWIKTSQGTFNIVRIGNELHIIPEGGLIGASYVKILEVTK